MPGFREFRRIHESDEIKRSLPYGGIIHFRFQGTERSAFISALRRPQRYDFIIFR